MSRLLDAVIRTCFTRRNRHVSGALAILVAAPLALAGCTPAPARVISGTIRGADFTFVDVMLGFDIIDGAGRHINVNGNPASGYGAIQRINYCVSAYGSKSATPGCNGQPSLTSSWSLQLPSNAVNVYVEAYPKRASSSGWLTQPNYVGPDPGYNDQSKYGMSYRRHVPVGTTNVSLVMPRNCLQPAGSPAGSTGSLWGYLYRGGTRWTGAGGSTNAWSTEPDNAYILGMNEGTADAATGTYHIDHLNQSAGYTIVANVGGITKQWLVGYQPPVTACQATRFDLKF